MRLVVLAFLLLAACDDQTPKDSPTELAIRAGEQSAQIQAMQDRLDKLDEQANAINEQEKADAADQLGQVGELRNTFNNDIDLDNKRDRSIYNLVQSVDRRLSRYDGQRSTSD